MIPTITTTEAARILNVTPARVIQLMNKGKLTALSKTSPNGAVRYHFCQLEVSKRAVMMAIKRRYAP